MRACVLDSPHLVKGRKPNAQSFSVSDDEVFMLMTRVL